MNDQRIFYPVTYPTALPKIVLDRLKRELDGSILPDYLTTVAHQYYDLLYGTPTWTQAQVVEHGFRINGYYALAFFEETDGTRHYPRFQFNTSELTGTREIWPIVRRINYHFFQREEWPMFEALDWWLTIPCNELFSPATGVGKLNDDLLWRMVLNASVDMRASRQQD